MSSFIHSRTDRGSALAPRLKPVATAPLASCPESSTRVIRSGRVPGCRTFPSPPSLPRRARGGPSSGKEPQMRNRLLLIAAPLCAVLLLAGVAVSIAERRRALQGHETRRPTCGAADRRFRQYRGPLRPRHALHPAPAHRAARGDRSTSAPGPEAAPEPEPEPAPIARQSSPPWWPPSPWAAVSSRVSANARAAGITGCLQQRPVPRARTSSSRARGTRPPRQRPTTTSSASIRRRPPSPTRTPWPRPSTRSRAAAPGVATAAADEWQRTGEPSRGHSRRGAERRGGGYPAPQ